MPKIHLNEIAALDAYAVYAIIKKLATPFNQTDAYKLGIIDDSGKVLKKRNSLKTSDEKRSYTILDTFIFNLKKLLEKIPGGKSTLSSYAAAFFLLKEYEMFEKYYNEELLSEHFAEFYNDIIFNDSKYELLKSFILEQKEAKTEDDEKELNDDVAANNAGSGNIAGLQGDPPIHNKKRKRKTFKEFK